MGVQVIVAYYALVIVVLIIVPICFLLVIIPLVRRGFIRLPRNRMAAPEELIDTIPRVEYRAELFDDATSGGYSSQCPVCLDSFNEQRDISCTPCTTGNHVFHTDCLRGWLQVARTCPLCRQDLVDAATET